MALPDVPSVDDVKFELLLEVVERSGRAEMRVHGTSMRPTIEPGTLVELSSPTARPRLGDVVCAYYQPLHLIHRVVGIGRTESGYEVQLAGDNHDAPDGWLPYACVRACLTQMNTGTGWRPIPAFAGSR